MLQALWVKIEKWVITWFCVVWEAKATWTSYAKELGYESKRKLSASAHLTEWLYLHKRNLVSMLLHTICGNNVIFPSWKLKTLLPFHLGVICDPDDAFGTMFLQVMTRFQVHPSTNLHWPHNYSKLKFKTFHTHTIAKPSHLSPYITLDVSQAKIRHLTPKIQWQLHHFLF